MDASPDGRLLATAGRDHVVRLWDLEKRTRLAALPRSLGPVHVVRFTPDGGFLATGGWDRSLKYFRTSGDFAKVYDGLFGAASPIVDVQFLPDGSALTALSNGAATISHPPPDVRLIREIRAEPDRLQTIALSPDGSTLACADDGDSVHVWNLASTQQHRRLPLQHGVGRLAAHPKSGVVALLLVHSPIVEVWDVDSNDRLARFQTADAAVMAARFADDGSTLRTVGVQGTVESWNWRDGARTAAAVPLGRPTAALAVSPAEIGRAHV